jgi:hypothetical protein
MTVTPRGKPTWSLALLLPQALRRCARVPVNDASPQPPLLLVYVLRTL